MDHNAENAIGETMRNQSGLFLDLLKICFTDPLGSASVAYRETLPITCCERDEPPSSTSRPTVLRVTFLQHVLSSQVLTYSSLYYLDNANPSHSWLPLLFIPTNASPAFIFLFFICTYFLNRPCVYCSILLLILFLTSCNWSDRCFFDFGSNWFLPRPGTSSRPISDEPSDAFNSTIFDMVNTTAAAIVKATSEDLAARRADWTGLGVEWLRNLLGKREWRIDCMDVYIRL
ncbi:hypothetical protein FZEAL_735 [Fusarium zealandicum]|uniref:Uncharacterized protein n=1 Tax=Fusarium zealandicum TaxID=1053134 RepID=A0A8H4UU56_9HYPO|nr:hypothetical protein FZEAL_735 [Fusarium zealandicum]